MEYVEDVQVLLVDDSDFFGSLAAGQLASEHGMETTTATSADEALSLLADLDVDCIVSDYDMPETDGLEFYRQVTERYGAVPFILLTGRSDEAIGGEAINAGVDDYIRKEDVTERDDFAVLANRVESVVSSRTARETFESVVENTGELILRFRTDGRVVAASDRIAEAFGVDASEAVGSALGAVVPSAVADRWLAAAEEAVETGETVSFDQQVGDTHHHALVVPVDGEPRTVQVTCRDISPRVERERDLEAATEQLELVNRFLRHDIRNDVDLVIAWSRQIADTAESPQQAEYAERILDTTRHILDLTQSAHDFVEAVPETAEAALEPVSLAAVLTEEVDRRRSTYEGADFRFHGEVPAVDVLADGMLSSVFRNILNNAVQHNDTDEPTVAVSVSVEPETVTVRVADDGPGVAPERREAIFGRGEDGADAAGTGIGLYLVDTLLSRYDGHVTVEDSDLGGAAFVVELPRA